MASKRKSSGKSKGAPKRKATLRNLKTKDKGVSDAQGRSVRGGSFQWGVGRGLS
jgi:hypothetical protein